MQGGREPAEGSRRSGEWSGDAASRERPFARRVPSNMSASSGGTAQPPQGTFLTRFLGNLRPSTNNGTGNTSQRPALPRSLSSPAPAAHSGLSTEGDRPSAAQGQAATPPSASTLTPSSSSTLAPPGPGTPVGSLARRFKFRRSRSSLIEADSPESSPPESPAVPSPASPAGAAATSPHAAPLSSGSPATIRGLERNPIDTLFGSSAATGRPPVIGRKSSTKSQQTITTHDHAYTSGYAPTTPLERIDEPGRQLRPHVDQSLELISTLLPPALLLLSQLGPTHLFSPPLQLPALFGVSLSNLAQQGGSISTANGSSALLSSAASIKSDATGSTSSASYFSTIPTATHVRPSHSHELHAPNTLSIPAVSAAALWRLFRGFEWIGEVGRGAQPLPPSVLSQSQGGEGAGPPQEIDDEPEQVFDFPSLLQGVADVLAADAAARGIELVVGQAGSGTAPSPAVTPSVAEAPGGASASARKRKDVETRELLVRADERAWSVTLVWVLHHILAGAASGSTVDVRFQAAAATPPTSPSQSRPSTPAEADLHGDLDALHSRPQIWWNVSLEIVVSSPAVPESPISMDESGAATRPPLPSPPFSTPFARSLFSLIQLVMADDLTQSDASTRSWSLEAMLPAARPKPPAEPEDANTLLGRRNIRLEPTAGQEPSINDLKRFTDSSLKGLKVALHAGETSAFAKHLTLYLAGWGMDVQHVPIETDIGSGGSRSSEASQSRSGSVPPAAARFDSGFETATTSPAASSDGKTSEFGIGVEGGSSLVIIDDDVATLRRLLISLRAPPLHYAPTLLAKRPQLASRRARSTPHVRQAPPPPHSQVPTSPWVIVHFASLIDYKEIKEIVQDALAMSRQPNLPEVLVVPKPAGPRRIMTAIWSALKRPSVDPTLPPIATSPSSPGVKYWTPRLSPSLNQDREFDFSGGEDGASSKGHASGSPGSTKARTPPTTYGPMTGTGLPPSPLGKISDTADSYFCSVTEELKESTPSEGMVVQSPDGRSGIFFQPQPRSRGHSFRERMRFVGGLERAPSLVAQQHIIEETPADLWNSADPPASVSVAAPHEIGLGSQTHSRRQSSSSPSLHAPPVEAVSGSASGPPGTPALALDTFISAAKSRTTVEDAVDVTGAGPGEPLSRTSSIRSPPPSRRSLSGSSAGGGNAPMSQRATGGAQIPATPSRQNSGGAVPAPAPATTAQSSAAAEGAAAAQALAKSPPPGAPGSKFRTKSSSLSNMPRARRRSSRRGGLPAVPPISVLIVEDNPINQTILSVFMKKKGITYKVAKDGQQAVDMWKKGNFHLVLMDIQLPVKSGIEATREIREMERLNNVGMLVTTPTSDLGSPASSASSNPLSTPNSPLLSMPVIIVALTASSLQADRVAALAAGCNDFLTKPVSLPWLESKLVEWGSMAYLSGFSRRSDTPSDATSLSSAPSSRGSTPLRPRSRSGTPSKYTQGFASRAEVVSQHLHIERPSSRAPSPSGTRSPDAPHSALPDLSPPVSAHSLDGSASGSTGGQPTLRVTSPTPQQTPHPVPVIPEAVTTPAAAAGGDARDTLARVDEVLETLVNEKPGDSEPTASTVPTRTPTSDNVATNDAVGEGDRLLNLSDERGDSADPLQT